MLFIYGVSFIFIIHEKYVKVKYFMKLFSTKYRKEKERSSLRKNGANCYLN